ncbi:Uncharacterised protein [Vibrio cholerae]|nr:Uncharacterised protein [Vibrio cholerae]
MVCHPKPCCRHHHQIICAIANRYRVMNFHIVLLSKRQQNIGFGLRGDYLSQHLSSQFAAHNF